jgi:hypothetical protein
MALFRYLLILISVGAAGFLGYISATERVNAPWIIGGFIVASLLNALYLSIAGPPNGTTKKFRVFRLISLWLDAKENELRQRAGKSGS